LTANAKALNDPANRIYGLALRGFAGAGQNMYIYPSLFRGFGGNWGTSSNIVVNSPEAVRALTWYVDTLTQYAPPAVRNWNWPDIADAFSQGTVATYIDAHSSAAVITNPEKSKVVGKIAYARWPRGPEWQTGDLDLELGLPDQRGAVRSPEKSDVALHRMGDVGRNAGTHVVEICGTREALPASTGCRYGAHRNSRRR
jgi:ABC-type glycerol-3-phosphate transport system substrate-binding protein